MKKAIVFLLFIISCYAIKNVGLGEEGYLIRADNYVLKLPATLKEPATINGMYKIQLVPTITTDKGESFSFLPVVREESIRGTKSRYSFEFEDKKGSISLWQRIDLTDEFISTTMKIKNEGNDEKKITVSFNVMGIKDNQVFFPSAVSKKAENYVVFSEKGSKGNSIGVKTNFELPKKGQAVLSQNNYGVIANFNLQKGETGTITVYYYPFYIQTQKTNFPLEYSSFLTEKTISTIGRPRFSISNETTDKIKALLDVVKNEKKSVEGEFSIIHKVDLTTEKDSLGMSAYFKKMCIEENMPCKLMIGRKGNKMYAWVRAYFNGWQDVDPFKGTKTDPGIETIFEEPSSKVVFMEKNTDEEFYKKTTWVKDVGKSNWWMYSIILLITAAAVIIFLQVKAGSIEKRMKKTEIIKEKINGKYEIVKKEEVKDEFVKEVLQKVMEKRGDINIDEMAEEMNYSKSLISYAIDYLKDEGFIRRIEAEKKEEGKEKQKKVKIDKRIIGTIAIIIFTIILILLLII